MRLKIKKLIVLSAHLFFFNTNRPQKKMDRTCRKGSSYNSIMFLVISIMFFTKTGNCELFTALTDMEELIETEALLIRNLETFLLAQEEKLDFIRM